MPFPLIPRTAVESIFQLTPQSLTACGITLLLADLDNTLAPYGEALPTEQVRAWARAMEAGGVTLFILSNSRKPTRVKVYAEALEVPYQGHSGKPKPGGFRRAMVRMGRTAAQTAMVGDQIFTDIWGASNAGVTPILVEPIRLAGNPGRYVRYAAELPFRWAGKRRSLC